MYYILIIERSRYNMNQEDIQKKQKKVMVYVMLLCIVLAVGVSYAYFTSGITSEDETTVTAEGGIMKINYNGGNTISLSGIYPRDEVWATKIITVTGNNTTDAEMYYKLNLVVDSNTFDTNDPLQYELISINTSDNGKVVPAISKTNLTSTSLELGKGNFIKVDNAKHTYQLKIYYPKKTTSQNSNQGATFSAHVEIAPEKAPKLITFTIDGVQYKAEKGMTWKEAYDAVYFDNIASRDDWYNNYGTAEKQLSGNRYYYSAMKHSTTYMVTDVKITRIGLIVIILLFPLLSTNTIIKMVTFMITCTMEVNYLSDY